MKRKLIGTFLGALLIATVALFGTATPSYAAEEIAKDGITYLLDEQSATAGVQGYDETLPNNITIPESVSVDNVSYSVTSIGDGAFSDCTSLESVEIPDSVTSIGDGAFSVCASLESIVIPDGVAAIGGSVFYDCASLESVEIPDSVTSIGDFAFYGCTSLVDIVIPDGVASIGEGAFSSCTGLKSIVIPDGVASISGSAFLDCTSLESIVLPDSIANIDGFAFYGCTSLADIVIPDGVESVGMNAFSGCTSLESVVFAGSPTSLDPYAFAGCTNLQNIFIPNDPTLAPDALSGAEGSPHLWRYEVTGDSSDGKVHVDIVSVTDKDGNPITETVSIPQDIMGSGYVIDKTPENVTFGQSFNVWVAGIQVTSLNADDVLGSADEGATVVYDAETNTLTLDNANIAVDDLRFAIYAEQDLTISLVGTNYVTLAGSAEISGLAWESALDGGYTVPEPAAPIACKGGSLTIQSDDSHGSLEATNGAGIVYRNDIGSLMSVGIVATGTVHIENAEVEATANFTYESNGAKEHSYGIFAGQGIVVDGADVIAASDQATQSAGIYALTGDISLNGNVIANGDRAVNHDNPYAAFSAGIYASEGSVNIAGGIVGATAAGLTEGRAAYGIFGYGGISITGGEVHAIGATSNMDGVDPLFGAGLFSRAGNIAISGKNTQVEADSGYASDNIAGIYANAGDVVITNASVKASAQNLYGGDTAVGIYAGKLQVARSNSTTGNITLTGADVQAVGITAPVSFTGTLAVAPAEGMRYAVDALDKMIVEYPELSWDEMAASAKGIEGSPFAEETSIDNELVAGQEYLHFYNVAAEAEPETPEEPTDPVVPEEPSEPNEPTETPDEDTDAVIPKTGDFGVIAPLAAAVCSALAIGAGMAIRRKNR